MSIKIMKKIFLLIALFPLIANILGCKQVECKNQTGIPIREISNMKVRIKKIKESVVRIHINGNPSGTGFIVSENGLIATCFHVVQSIQPGPNNQPQISHALNIEIELYNGTKLPGNIHQSCQTQGFIEALSKDYTLLEVNTDKKLSPISIGSFADIEEGDKIYICGFPYGIDKPFISSGMLSTKLKINGYLGQGMQRDAAYLDITLNKGNSGGPVILMKDNAEDDIVIGIATFTMTPLSEHLKKLVAMINTFPGNIVLMGVDFKTFSTLIKNSFENTSVGMGGCISIDYLNKILKK